MFSIFKKYPDILAEISRKSDGNMKIFSDRSLIADGVLENRRKYFLTFGIGHENVVSADLVHGDNVIIINKNDSGRIIPETDALITRDRDIFVSVTVADCLPVFLFDPKKQAVGVIHAGWRGLEKNIISKTIKKLQEGFGSVPENILAAIGPGICVEHYEVSEETAKSFRDYPEAIMVKEGKVFLDIKKIASIQLSGVGLSFENIEIGSECTFLDAEKYFSYRRDKPAKVEAQIAVIGLKSGNLV